MVFSSPVFLFLFLPLVLVLALSAKERSRQNILLLIASLFFYAWGEGAYVLLMLALVLVNYLSALALERWKDRRSVLAIAIFLNLGALAFFKYANFLVDNLNVLLSGSAIPPLELEPIHLPIGVSFFVFQGLSYVIDVSRGHARAQEKPGAVALYISLFPQLIAGPIVRYGDVAAQIQDRTTSLPLFTSGVRRFIIGLSKKVLIADQVARIADPIFELDPGSASAPVAWLGLVAYAIQIYFDFSGYSDMAIGLGRMFGFSFLENFNRPYIAASVREFWQRWHISLSQWFRDYLYIPLGGNRKGPLRTYVNLFTVFFLTGLWHGASWNFVVWGLIHGTFMVIERAGLIRVLDKLPKVLGQLYTLSVVLIAWAFFRLEDLPDTWSFLENLFGRSLTIAGLYSPIQFLTNTSILALSVGILGALDVHARVAKLVPMSIRTGPAASRMLTYVEVVGLLVLLLLVGMHVASNTFSPFIYFRF